MFARMLEFVPKFEKKDEFINVMKKDILPILQKQTGFVEILPFVPQEKTEKMIVVSLWTDQKWAEQYMRETYPKVEQFVKPYVTSTIVYKPYELETVFAERFEKTVAA